MAITAVYALLTATGECLSHKITKPYRDTYYPDGFLLLATAQLVELPTFAELMRAGELADPLAEEDDEEEEEPRSHFTDAELSPEINSLAAQTWAKRTVKEAQLAAEGLAEARAVLGQYCGPRAAKKGD